MVSGSTSRQTAGMGGGRWERKRKKLLTVDGGDEINKGRPEEVVCRLKRTNV